MVALESVHEGNKGGTFHLSSQAPGLFKLMEERRICFQTNRNHVILS